MKHKEDSENDVRRLINSLKETLNPEMPRCIVDSFLVQKNRLEVSYIVCSTFHQLDCNNHESLKQRFFDAWKESGIMDSQYHEDNLLYCVINLFTAGTENTGHTLSWSLLFMAKYPHIQGDQSFVYSWK